MTRQAESNHVSLIRLGGTYLVPSVDFFVKYVKNGQSVKRL